MARGQKTGGRRKGSLNQRTLAMQEHVAALADNATPLDLLMSVYRNPELPIELRVMRLLGPLHTFTVSSNQLSRAARVAGRSA